MEYTEKKKISCFWRCFVLSLHLTYHKIYVYIYIFANISNIPLTVVLTCIRRFLRVIADNGPSFLDSDYLAVSSCFIFLNTWMYISLPRKQHMKMKWTLYSVSFFEKQKEVKKILIQKQRNRTSKSSKLTEFSFLRKDSAEYFP